MDRLSPRCQALARPPRPFARRRAGLSVVEVLVIVLCLGVVTAVAVPCIQHAREAARRQSCRDHLRSLTLALRAYHDTHGVLPPAAVWDVEMTASLALHGSRQIDLITRENWAMRLLPLLGHDDLARQFAADRPIGASENAAARAARPAPMICPADPFNRGDNPYRFCPQGDGGECLEFARGNYALNGGSHDAQFAPPDTSSPKGDAVHLLMREEPRQFALWGSGVAGINRSFSVDEFSNGQSTLVALDELRSGIHPLDPRGVWSLGQIGGSITWAHGVNGDAYGPNNPWPRADDVLGCAALHEAVGSETLLRERMPCVDYVDANQQAAARSLHPGGVHIALLDGAVRFIADEVDPALWHVMHSRETPASVLAEGLDQRLTAADVAAEAPRPRPPDEAPPENAGDFSSPPEGAFENSLGMTFTTVPAGDFTMGVPDERNGGDSPPECPAHTVRITRPLLLGAHEVTRGQFRQVMDSLPAAEAAGDAFAREQAPPDDLPVVNVTWDEADEFCRRLSQRTEERRAGRWYRLPSEAEWEYACRAGRSEPYRWRRDRESDDVSGEAAGIQPPLPLMPVGTYPPNEFGLHDMRGNVWEWTADWFDRDYYLRSPVDDPRGPAGGYLKVVRGGDWRFVGEVCRIDYPQMPPWKANPFVGFRVICERTATAESDGNSLGTEP